jgi:hypothetical protein
MTGISLNELVGHYPYLYHMAEADSWESIQEKGLLSTSALLDLFEVNGKDRFAIESCHRPDSVTIEHPKHGRAVIRDQKPMHERSLVKCLQGISPRKWYEFLNGKVFLWAALHRLEGLLNARAYRGKEHVILKVDASGLMASYASTVLLSPINSGSTIYRPSLRSIKTFQPLKTYPFEERREKRGVPDAVAEMAFDYAIPDIRRYVLRVEKRRENRVLKVIWKGS